MPSTVSSTRKIGGKTLLNANGFKPLAQRDRAELRADLIPAKLTMKTQQAIDTLIDLVFTRCAAKGLLSNELSLIDVMVNVTFDDILTRTVHYMDNPASEEPSEEEVIVPKKKVVQPVMHSTTQAFHPSMQAFQPVAQAFQPVAQTFQPVAQAYHPAMQAFQPVVQPKQKRTKMVQVEVSASDSESSVEVQKARVKSKKSSKKINSDEQLSRAAKDIHV